MSQKDLVKGARFTTCDDFFTALTDYNESENQRISVKRSKTIEQVGLQRHINESLVYYELFLECARSGIYKPKGRGLRQTRSQKTNCSVKITLKPTRDGQYLEILIINLIHNHPAYDAQQVVPENANVEPEEPEHVEIVPENRDAEPDEPEQHVESETTLRTEALEGTRLNIAINPEEVSDQDLVEIAGSVEYLILATNDGPIPLNTAAAAALLKSVPPYNPTSHSVSKDLHDEDSSQVVSEEEPGSGSSSTSIRPAVEAIEVAGYATSRSVSKNLHDEDSSQVVSEEEPGSGSSSTSIRPAVEAIEVAGYATSRSVSKNLHDEDSSQVVSEEEPGSGSSSTSIRPAVEAIEVAGYATSRSVSKNLHDEDSGQVVSEEEPGSGSSSTSIRPAVEAIEVAGYPTSRSVSKNLHDEGSSRVYSCNEPGIGGATEDPTIELMDIVIPDIRSRGRRRGAALTAIGLPIQKKNVKFASMTDVDKAKKILGWIVINQNIIASALSGEYIIPVNDIESRPESLCDSIANSEDVELDIVKPYLTEEAFAVLTAAVKKKVENDVWICTPCGKRIRGKSVICESCLKWYHTKCVPRIKKNADWFCGDCK